MPRKSKPKSAYWPNLQKELRKKVLRLEKEFRDQYTVEEKDIVVDGETLKAKVKIYPALAEPTFGKSRVQDRFFKIR